MLSIPNTTSTISSTNTLPNITEKDVGILQFLNESTPKIDCVLKHRFSDFIVNEIDEEGKVVWLKDDSLENKGKIGDVIETSEEENKGKFEMTEEKAAEVIAEKFGDVLEEEERERLEKFVVEYVNKMNKINDSFNVKYIENKEKRKAFHELIRGNFPFLDSETCEDKKKNVKFIKISYMSKANFYRSRKVFPDKTKTVLHFSLLKRNIDTGGALTLLSRLMHRSPKSFGFAGNKDKRGITTQRISIANTLPIEVCSALGNKKSTFSFEVGNFSFSDKQLKLGMLKGNQFCVTLRFVDMEGGVNPSSLSTSLSSLSSLGFLNYFGMQRFGTSLISTHEIGKFVLKREWKRVFLGILTTEEMKKAEKIVGVEGNLEGVFGEEREKQLKIIADFMKILRKNSTEWRILGFYKRNGVNSFKNAFQGLSKQLQVLYPHAYQSYIWNMSVSFRIEKLGRKLTMGDIVKKKDSNYKEIVQEENISGELDEIIEGEDLGKVEEAGERSLKEEQMNVFKENFEYITEENISKYSFSDLVLPLVGGDILYPKNEVKGYMDSLLKKDGLEYKDFDYQSKYFNFSGYYRKVVEKPINGLTYDILKHDDPDEDLQTPYYNTKPQPQPKGSKFTSLRLVFQLRQSTYATMLFRELTKNSSAFSHQSKMSKKNVWETNEE